MLQVKEEDRISWYELFEHPLIKSNEETLALHMVKINEIEDELERQAKINQLYIENCMYVDKENN